MPQHCYQPSTIGQLLASVLLQSFLAFTIDVVHENFLFIVKPENTVVMADSTKVLQHLLDESPVVSPARALILKLQTLLEAEQKAFTKDLIQDQDILPQSLGEAGPPLHSTALASWLM